MDFLSNIILATAAVGAAIYCLILSRRLSALTSLEGGMGNAIAVLSAQVDDLSKTLSAAQQGAGASSRALTEQTARAEAAAKRLELLVASMHDLPASPEPDVRQPPSRWTGAQKDPACSPAEAPPRARVLRRRREAGEA